MSTKISKAFNAIKRGELVIVIDDYQRENEGDLVMAAEKVTPLKLNFMAENGRGLINLCLTQKLATKLKLAAMTADNQAKFGTNFTVSLDAKEGITTGSSFYDQAKTIKLVTQSNAKEKNFVRPGHIFPLVAHRLGVLGRPGHTEAAVDLVKLAGLKPIGIICEIISPRGNMAGRQELEQLAGRYNLPLLTVADIIKYRLQQEVLVKRLVKAKLPTEFGFFQLYLYQDGVKGQEHIVLVNNKGLKNKSKRKLVRLHSSCLTGDVFTSQRCDCHWQLRASLEIISQTGGVIIYLDQEGRGIGLTNKLKAYALQDKGLDTVEANRKLGFQPDERQYWVAAHILKDLGIKKIKLLTNNPRKVRELRECGLSVSRSALQIKVKGLANKYLAVKKEKLGHLLV